MSNFLLTDDITFYVGEVKSYVNTFKQPILSDDNPDSKHDMFLIDVLVTYNEKSRIIQNIRPANSNFKQIPIIGESVLIYNGYSQNTTSEKRQRQWYYFAPINVQTNTNHNITPIYSASDFEVDPDFKDTIVSPLQPYVGDVMLEGRWGNSIRLGNTPTNNTQKYSVTPSWIGNSLESPIIILSNGRENTKSYQYVVEDIENDFASLYLTSKQSIPRLQLGSINQRNQLDCYESESAYSKSQFIGVADRVILKAKTDIAVIDAPSAIILNTTGDVRIGSDSANESMVHGQVLLNILQKIINQLQVPVQCGSSVGTFLSTSAISSAQSQLSKLLSSKYFIKKETY